MQLFAHNMFKWIHWLLAIHLTSAAFINTNLKVPFAAIVPNQLRIYREYTVQHDDANADQSEGLHEGQKILVNCTIRSINVTNKETGKILKRTTANCTVTHIMGLESNAKHFSTDEKRVNKMEKEIPKLVIDSAVTEDADNLEPNSNNSDVSYTSVNGQPSSKDLKAIEKLDRSNKESEHLIPAIIGAVTSHSQDGNGIGENNIKIAVEKIDPMFEAALLRSNKDEQITPVEVDTVQQNNDVGTFQDTVQNANNESIFTSRRVNNEATLTEVYGTIQKSLNFTGQQSIEEATISPLKGGSEQNTSRVSGNSTEIERLNSTRIALINTKNPVVRPGTDDIQRYRDTTENTPKSLSQDDRPTNHYNYSFDNSGRLIETQTPITIDYRAPTVNEEPLQRLLENTSKPSKNWRKVNKQRPHQLSSKTVNKSTSALVKDSENQNSRSASKIAFERRVQGTTAKSLSESTEEYTQSASDLEHRSDFERTIGSSQVKGYPDLNNRPGQSRRAGHLKILSFRVADSPDSKTGNEYPLAGQVQSYPEQNPSQLNHRLMKYFNTNAEPTFDQLLGHKTLSYIQNSRLRQRQFVYSQRPPNVHMNQISGTSKWDFANVPRQKTIWDTLEDATNKAHKRIYHKSGYFNPMESNFGP